MASRGNRRQFLKAAGLATAGAGLLGAPAVAGGPVTLGAPAVAGGPVALGAPAAAAGPGSAIPDKIPDNSSAQVVVVGAGFAGMVAAYRLSQRGYSVIVVDALDRVGGRSWSTNLSDGTFVDIGAGWTGSTQYAILQLIQELGLSIYTQYGLGTGQPGNNLFVGLDGKIASFKGVAFPVSKPEQVAYAIGAIDTFAQTVPLDAPWTAPNAAEWDNTTAGAALTALFPNDLFPEPWAPDALAAAMVNLVSIFGLSPFAVSFLHLLWVAHSFGGVEKAGAVEAGSVQFRIVGGTQQIPLGIAARLGKNTLLFNSPVYELNQDDAGVTVVSERATLRARRVIVAVPTCLSGFIRYSPILPADRGQLIQRVPQGSAMKLQLIYDRAFWRDLGYNGNSFAINGSIVPQTLDAGGPAGVDAPGILACFVDDDAARDLGRLSPTERQQRIIEELVPRFTSQVRNLSTRLKPNYVEFISQDLEWARGDFAATPGPRVLTASGFGPAMRDPFMRIHWAGVDTATTWYQSIDGAAQSGERAALEVINAGL